MPRPQETQPTPFLPCERRRQTGARRQWRRRAAWRFWKRPIRGTRRHSPQSPWIMQVHENKKIYVEGWQKSSGKSRSNFASKWFQETHSTSLIPLRSRMILRMRSTLMARRIRLLLFTTATLFPAIHSCNGQAPLKIEQDQKTERLCVIIMIFRMAMTKKRSLCQGKLVL
jgi:hypothetical protein